MGEMNVYSGFVGKLEWKRPLALRLSTCSLYLKEGVTRYASRLTSVLNQRVPNFSESSRLKMVGSLI
jgi:hypothetical protein